MYEDSRQPPEFDENEYNEYLDEQQKYEEEEDTRIHEETETYNERIRSYC